MGRFGLKQFVFWVAGRSNTAQMAMGAGLLQARHPETEPHLALPRAKKSARIPIILGLNAIVMTMWKAEIGPKIPLLMGMLTSHP